ncbi:MAG: hypothetical protein KGL25_01080 [Gammaproteobacteria bacterium]|nr:hypothetical protein [Gammaproteobacteria bacterium]
MSSRINMGLKAKGKGGYHGYKWKHIREPMTLYVWSFVEGHGKSLLRDLETIEAEIAFRVRRDTGRWPLSQTEIHFYDASPAHKKAVEVIYGQCMP